MTANTASIVESIRQRSQSEKQPFGYGLSTAAPYVRAMLEVWTPPDWSSETLIKEASSRLVYTNPDMIMERFVRGDSDEKATILPKGIEAPPHTKLLIRHVLTTPRQDRDKDILRTEGAKLDPKAPLLWQHVWALPVGPIIRAVEHTDKVLKVVSAVLDLNDLTSDIVKLVEADVLRFSHGFLPTVFEPLKGRDDQDGFDIKEFEIMEGSLVSVPSNTEAEVEVFATTQLQSGLFKAYAQKIVSQRPVIVRGHDPEESAPTFQVKQFVPEHKFLNVESEHLEASKLEYEWTSRFLGCEVKEMMVTGTFVPKMRMGSFLTGIQSVRNCEIHDTRRLTRDGKEKPPIHEVIQLNSEKRETFLVDGIEFCVSGDKRFAVKYEPSWRGLFVTTYSKSNEGSNLIDKAWEWATENNFLKGEAFSLTGDFLARDADYGWDEVFLDEKNIDPLKRVVGKINTDGKSAANRGIIMAGNPGTGKTLSARIMMNQARATFIWVAAKDFWRAGATDGLIAGFELAAELAPSILCFEDIDNWLGDSSIDIIKTEMDGVRRTSGIVTILTTNFPERLPKALIDRPGRFHNVLQFDPPSKDIRLKMLGRWMRTDEDNTKWPREKSLADAAEHTDGFSGAHIYELCSFAKTLRDDDGISPDDALQKAIETVKQQRDLINGQMSRLREITIRAKTGTPYRSTPASTSAAWDASAAVGRLRDWAKSDADEIDLQISGHRTRYVQGFARVSDDGMALGDYSFPHHDVEDGKIVVNRAGVSSGIAVINGARGGANFESDAERRAVFSHLRQHLSDDFDVDEDDLPQLRSAAGTTQKQGRVISKATLESLKSAVDDLEAAAGVTGLPRASEALIERASRRLKTLIDTVEADSDETSKQHFVTVREALTVFLASANDDELARARGAIDSILTAAELEVKAARFRELSRP